MAVERGRVRAKVHQEDGVAEVVEAALAGRMPKSLDPIVGVL